jgi:hypothetical protein
MRSGARVEAGFVAGFDMLGRQVLQLPAGTPHALSMRHTQAEPARKT